MATDDWLTREAAIAGRIIDPTPHRALAGDAATLRRIGRYFITKDRPAIRAAGVALKSRHPAPQGGLDKC
jgi:hypothetical protein